MLVGPILNASAIILGGTLGAFWGHRVPQRIRDGLPAIFALASISLGVLFLQKVNQMSVVILALILGTIIGEWLNLEVKTQALSHRIRRLIEMVIPIQPSTLPSDVYKQNYTAVIVLFCTGSTGIVGALTEGMTGDYQLLLIKSLMDLFTALTFAAMLGLPVAFIALPLFIIESTLYFFAKFIMAYTDAISFGDFSACGGVIMIAVGFRIAQIKIFSVVNFLPALLLIIPLSYLWRALF